MAWDNSPEANAMAGDDRWFFNSGKGFAEAAARQEAERARDEEFANQLRANEEQFGRYRGRGGALAASGRSDPVTGWFKGLLFSFLAIAAIANYLTGWLAANGLTLPALLPWIVGLVVVLFVRRLLRRLRR